LTGGQPVHAIFLGWMAQGWFPPLAGQQVLITTNVGITETREGRLANPLFLL